MNGGSLLTLQPKQAQISHFTLLDGKIKPAFAEAKRDGTSLPYMMVINLPVHFTQIKSYGE